MVCVTPASPTRRRMRAAMAGRMSGGGEESDRRSVTVPFSREIIGAIFDTSTAKGRSGKPSSTASPRKPGRIKAIFASATSASITMFAMSAIASRLSFSRTLSSLDSTVLPTCAVSRVTVPDIGARTVSASTCSRALSISRSALATSCRACRAAFSAVSNAVFASSSVCADIASRPASRSVRVREDRACANSIVFAVSASSADCRAISAP